MSGNKEKQFSIRQVFTNLSSVSAKQTINGDVVKRFGVYWKIQLYKYGDGDIVPYLMCESSETGVWSISTTCDVTVGGKLFKTGVQFDFTQNNAMLDPHFIRISNFPDYGIKESASITYNVNVNKMTGIKEKQKSMNYEDDVAKESSDVVLMVGDQKFHVFKNYLSLHSTYFKSLFSGNFAESEKYEIELKDIDPEDFQNFLELIYGISLVDDDTVSEILNLADFFDAKFAIQRIEAFLLNDSKQSLKSKFHMAIKYKLEKLKEKCFSEMKNRSDFQNLAPETPEDFSPAIWNELYNKAVQTL